MSTAEITAGKGLAGKNPATSAMRATPEARPSPAAGTASTDIIGDMFKGGQQRTTRLVDEPRVETGEQGGLLEERVHARKRRRHHGLLLCDGKETTRWCDP